jgi:hypothetical protein
MGSRQAVPLTPSKSLHPLLLLSYKQKARVTHLESALIEVLILKSFKFFRMNTCNNHRGWGVLLLTRNPSQDFCPTCPACPDHVGDLVGERAQQVAPLSSVFATLTKTPGVYPNSSHSGTIHFSPSLLTSLPPCFQPVKLKAQHRAGATHV